MTSATTTDQMFYIPAHRSWSLSIIAGGRGGAARLCACPGPQNLSAAQQATSMLSARCYLTQVRWR
jgi:hypothetical protein